MSAHRYRATWRSITFNQRYDDTGLVDDSSHLNQAFVQDDLYLDSLDISRVTVDDFREMRQFLEGAEPNDSVEGVLLANLHGHIQAPSAARLEDQYWTLREQFSPASVRLASQSLTPKGVLPLDFKVDSLAGISARRLYARPAIGRPVIVGRVREGLIRRFLIQLISYDPRVVSQTLTQTTVTAGGTVTNGGLAYTNPSIRIAFSGAGNAALTITNSTTGKSIVINATTAANGEAWVIDVARGTLVRESDSANRYSQRVSGYISDLFLLAGANVIAVANTGGVSAIRVDHRNAWA